MFVVQTWRDRFTFDAERGYSLVYCVEGIFYVVLDGSVFVRRRGGINLFVPVYHCVLLALT